MVTAIINLLKNGLSITKTTRMSISINGVYNIQTTKTERRIKMGTNYREQYSKQTAKMVDAILPRWEYVVWLETALRQAEDVSEINQATIEAVRKELKKADTEVQRLNQFLADYGIEGGDKKEEQPKSVEKRCKWCKKPIFLNGKMFNHVKDDDFIMCEKVAEPEDEPSKELIIPSDLERFEKLEKENADLKQRNENQATQIQKLQNRIDKLLDAKF